LTFGRCGADELALEGLTTLLLVKTTSIRILKYRM